MARNSVTYVALLRSVNVGGTGKLPMQDLKALCVKLGFANVRTYIASGNALFESTLKEVQVKQRLEKALAAYAGKPIAVLVRTAAEMTDITAANPWQRHAPGRTVAIFLDEPPPADTASQASGRKDELIALGKREIYVYYGDGMADSRLRFAASRTGTSRNMNTVRKLAELAAGFKS